jgi:hypothetical protein
VPVKDLRNERKRDRERDEIRRSRSEGVSEGYIEYACASCMRDTNCSDGRRFPMINTLFGYLKEGEEGEKKRENKAFEEGGCSR